MTKSTITRNELNEVIATYGKSQLAHRMATVLLAAMDSEPVAYGLIFRNMDGVLDNFINTNTVFATREKAEAYGKGGSYEERSDGGLEWVPNTALDPVVIPLYSHAQPAPVVPDDVLEALQKVARIRLDLNDFDGDHRGLSFCLSDAEETLIDVVNRRADMFAAAPRLPGSEPAAVPGKWIPVSERMPDDDDFVYIWPRPDFGVELHVGQYCECSPKGDGWYAQVYEQNYGIEWHPITVTHWMPLPAAPQEVNRE